MLNQVKHFPYLKDKSIYLGVKLSVNGKPKMTQYALLEIPSDPAGRFVILPSVNNNHYVNPARRYHPSQSARGILDIPF
jgi:polyphosphate kinase